MPHLVLHVSPELQDQNWQPFFKKAHALLAPYANIDSCKSRVNVLKDVYIGKGESDKALVYLELALRPRPEEVLQEIGDALFLHLKYEAAPILKAKGLDAEPTMEIRILTHYWQ